MKKSLYALLVIALSSVGANALAEKFDMNIKRAVTETADKGSGSNGEVGPTKGSQK